MKKTHVNSNVDLNTLAGGAFAEKVNEALVQVGENIQNQNTEATKKRKITITMTFAPNKTRQLVNTQIGVTTTLAATEAVDTQMVMGMKFGQQYDQESFIVSLQSCFQNNGDREAVAMLASNIVNNQQQEYSDDGITQQAVIKTGITTKQAALVPNPVHLVPYRTFLEVEQPASDFVFRISEGRGGEPVFKLVAADGGLWKAEAVDNIKKYLEDALDGIENREQITIIA